jgi:hypothetical protein
MVREDRDDQDYFYDPENEDRDGLRNVGLYKTEPPHPADNPRKLHYTHLPGKHQIVDDDDDDVHLVSCTKIML